MLNAAAREPQASGVRRRLAADRAGMIRAKIEVSSERAIRMLLIGQMMLPSSSRVAIAMSAIPLSTSNTALVEPSASADKVAADNPLRRRADLVHRQRR